MNVIKKHGLLIFWLLLYADCALLYFNKTAYHPLVKSALIPVLLIYLFTNSAKTRNKNSRKITSLALFFSWVGDILLTRSGDSFFMLGMCSFLTMHILYILYFIRLRPIRLSKFAEGFVALVIAGIASYQVLNFLKPYLGNFFYPFAGYAVVITLMAVCATNIAGSKTLRSLAVGYFIPAAALFILSDAVLALDKFYFKEPFLQIVIMMTYGYAQYLFTCGFAKHFKA
jgi:uncharacterized membrane protein YhhN